MLMANSATLMPGRPALVAFCFLTAVAMVSAVAAHAATPDVAGLDSEAIEHDITSLKADSEVSDAARKQALDIYQQALSALDSASDQQDKIKKLKQQVEQAPTVLARLQRQLN